MYKLPDRNGLVFRGAW